MSAQVFKFTCFLIISSLAVLSNCGEKEKNNEETGQIRGDAGKRVARYAASVFEKPGDRKDNKRIAVLAKGEEITLKKLLLEKNAKGQEEEYALVELAGGKSGYLGTKHLALSAVVVTGEELRIYKRPTVSSGPQGWGPSRLPPGTVAFVHSEDYNNGDWLEVSGHVDGKFFRGWLQVTNGVKRHTQVVVAALLLEASISILQKENTSAEQREKALRELASLRDDGPPLGKIASEFLEKTKAPLESAPSGTDG